MTDIEEFRFKTKDQLTDELAKLKKEQFNLRFQRASGQLENTARIRIVRRDIARVMTVLSQQGATAQPAAAPAKAAAAKKAPKAKAKPKAAAEKPAKRATRAKKEKE